MNSKLNKIVLTVFMILTMAFTATAFAAEGSLDWENGVITVEGYGVAPQGYSYTQGKIMAREAAIVEAYKALAEEVDGVNIDGVTTIQNAAVANETINMTVNAVIKGAKVLSVTEQADGSMKAIVQLRLFGEHNSLSSAIFQPGLPTQTAQAPEAFGNHGSMAAAVPKSAVGTTATGKYTGLIIDCTGLSLRPAMSPVIRTDTGAPIYGHKNLDSKMVIKYGMAGYARSMDGATRAGSNPLVIKAVSLENNDSYPVISSADANRVLVENQATHFLDKCAVVFLR